MELGRANDDSMVVLKPEKEWAISLIRDMNINVHYGGMYDR
jgi:hypothetical protein